MAGAWAVQWYRCKRALAFSKYRPALEYSAKSMTLGDAEVPALDERFETVGF